MLRSRLVLYQGQGVVALRSSHAPRHLRALQTSQRHHMSSKGRRKDLQLGRLMKTHEAPVEMNPKPLQDGLLSKMLALNVAKEASKETKEITEDSIPLTPVKPLELFDNGEGRRQRSAAMLGTNGDSLRESLKLFREMETQYEFAQLPNLAKKMLPLINDREKDQEKLLQEFDSALETKSEVLEAWQVVTCMSTVIKDFDWNDERLTVLVEALAGALRSMTFAQLTSCVQHISLLQRYPRPIPKAILNASVALDKECTRRLRAEEMRYRTGKDKALATSDGRNSLLRCGYAWIRAHEVTMGSVTEFRGNFLYKLVDSLVAPGDVRESLDHNEFVFLFFVMGQLRYDITYKMIEWAEQRKLNPGYWRRMRAMDEEEYGDLMEEEAAAKEERRRRKGLQGRRRLHMDMPGPLAMKLQHTIHNVSFQEVGILAHAIYKISYRFHRRDDRIQGSIVKAALTSDESQILNHDLALNSVCKVIRNRIAPIPWAIEDLFNKFEPVLQHMNSFTIVRMLSIVTVKCPREYKSFLDAAVKVLNERKFETLRLKDLQGLSYTLYHLDYCSDDKNSRSMVFRNLLATIEVALLGDPRAARSATYVLLFAGKCGVFDPAISSQFFDEVNLVKDQIMSLELDCPEFIDLAVEVMSRIGRRSLSYLPDEVKVLRKHDRRVMTDQYRTLMLNVAIHDWDLELGGLPYEGSRLDPELRLRLLQQPTRSNSVPKVLEATTDRTIEVERNLNNLMLHPVALTSLTTFPQTKELVFCLEPLQDPRVIVSKLMPKAFTGKLGSDYYLQAPLSFGRWFVMVMSKERFVDAGGNMLGPMLHKKRSLESLGYNVILLNTIDFQRVRQHKQDVVTEGFLRTLIHEANREAIEKEKRNAEGKSII